ncbi:MAG: Gldg family protein [Pseudoruminococcus massiliensis]|jgi:ABC-2 type transport system permease protein|uniref:Gldg family protein n=1 Tax=Pseudoruminococcus massiliensis TaxID=2086583 RepID=UPI003990F1D5|nr:GldG family protein [Oscillospiraceae bacterium]
MNNDENKKELSAEEIIEAEKPETEKIEINSKSEVKAYNTNSDGQNSKKKKTKSPKAPRQKMSKARFNHTIGALVITAVVLVATILLNVVVSLMSDKLPGMSIDLTSTGAFQLSETSIKLAQNVKKDLKITFLDDKQSYRSKASSNTYYAQVMAIAEEYGKYNNKISAEYISIVDNPNFENKYPQETLSADNIIVSCGDKYRILDQYDIFNVKSYYSTYSYIASSKAEEAFDGAILAVTSTESTKLAIVEDNSTEDFTYFKNILEQNNYELVSVKLEQEDIPKDAKMLIVFTPEKDFSKAAAKKIRTYLENNKEYGKNMLYIPSSKTYKTPNLDEVLSDWGITVGDGLAYELESSSVYGRNMYDGILCYMGSNAFTSKFDDNSAPVISSYARPITLDSDAETQSLLQYSSKSGVCPSDADDSYDFTGNAKGNIIIAGYGVNGIFANDKKSSDKISTVFVFGSSTMFEKTILASTYSDQKYILAMLSESCGRVDQEILVEAKELTQYDVQIDNNSASVIGLVCYVGLPIAVICAGLIVFVKRRNI